MKFIAKTLYGLEGVLSGELEKLGASDIVTANRAVVFSGDKKMLYTVNYMSRVSLSVLYQISEFYIKSADDLYRRALKIRWDEFMDADSTFSVVPVVQSPLFNHTGFPALRLKDSVADYFRQKQGRRPSVDTANPDIIINLHISNEKVTVSLDSSAVPLFKRGYRLETVAAPLNEVLAAGMLGLSGWNASSNLIDPMCGSGTLPVEAAMAACDIPAGKFREFFGFQKWKDFDESLFISVKSESDSRIREKPGIEISGYDISPGAVAAANANIGRAGLENIVRTGIMDFRDLQPSAGGCIFINPPYGERMSQGETDSVYSMIGSALKHNFSGFTAWIISSNRESMKYIGLKPFKKFILFNGALECLFAGFDLYSGSRKGKTA